MNRKPESDPNASSAILARELAALFALALACAWMAFALTRSGSGTLLAHPLIAAGLVFLLWPFRRETYSRRIVGVAIAVLLYWLAARLSIVWVPFLVAFILAYLIRFLQNELRAIRIPRVGVIALPRWAANVVILVSLAGVLGVFAFAAVPTVIAQAAQLISGVRIAYTRLFLYRVEQIPIAEALQRVQGGESLVLAEPLPLGDRIELPAGASLNAETLRLIQNAGVSTLAVHGQPIFYNLEEQFSWVQDLAWRAEELLGEDFLASLQNEFRQRLGQFSEWAGRFVNWLFSRSAQLISGAFGFVAMMVFALVVLAYLLRAYDNYLEAMLLVFPPESWAKVRRIARGIDANLHAFLRGQMVIVLTISLLSWLAYALIGVPYAFLIGILGGLFNTIPNVGPVLAGFVAALTLLVGVAAGNLPPVLFFLHPEGLRGVLMRLLLIPLATFVVQTIDNSLISPRVMSRAVNIDPLAIMLAVLAGGSLLGVWGVVLAIPALVIAKAAWEHSGEPRPEASDQPSEPPRREDEVTDLSELF